MNPLLLPHDYDRSPFGRVRDLRRLLDERGESPEQLAVRTGVSNMTWRRLLAKRDATTLPEKYRAILERHFAPAPALDPEGLALSGHGGSESQLLQRVAHDGRATENLDEVVRDADRKRSTTPHLPERLVAHLAGLVALVPSAPLAAKALIAGALLYFLNPFDLVADALVGIGFIDDIGVLGIVVRKLRGNGRATNAEPRQA